MYKNGARSSGESYYMICGTGDTSRHSYMYSHATEKTDLVFSTSYEDETSADEERRTTSSVQNISELEGIRSSEGLLNDMCEVSTVTK